MSMQPRGHHFSPGAVSLAAVLVLMVGMANPRSGLAGVDLLGTFEFEIGANVFSGGLQVLADPGHPLRSQAILAARELGRDALDAAPYLIAAINDGDSDIRYSAGRALSSMRPLTPGDLAALVKLLNSDDMEVKKTVARVLGSMGHDALLAVPRLLEEWEKLKSDPDALKWGPDARAGPAWVFAEAIGQIDPSREEVVRVLIDTRIHTLTRSDFSFGRWHWAAVHLGNMKVRDDREICEALESVVQIDSGPARANLSWNAETNDRTALRVVAARALSKRRPSPELVRWLVESVAADANRTRRDILEAIGELGPQGEPALPYLIQIVERRRQMNSSGPACDAMLAIGRIGSAASGTVPVLMSVLDDDWGSSSYICPAIQSLGLLGESASGALVSLQAKLAHPNPEVQVAAATAIRRIGGNTSATIPVLIEGLRFDDISRPYVFPHFASWFLRARMAAQIRISAANGLAELGADAVTAMPALIRIASNDRFPTVREAAQNAALRIRARSK